MDALASDPEDRAAMDSLDALHGEYDQMYTHAVALAQDDTNSALEATRVKVRRRVTKELTKEQTQQQRSEQAPTEQTPAPAASLPRRIVRRVRAARAK
jgi:hypothetical protein